MKYQFIYFLRFYTFPRIFKIGITSETVEERIESFTKAHKCKVKEIFSLRLLFAYPLEQTILDWYKKPRHKTKLRKGDGYTETRHLRLYERLFIVNVIIFAKIGETVAAGLIIALLLYGINYFEIIEKEKAVGRLLSDLFTFLKTQYFG